MADTTFPLVIGVGNLHAGDDAAGRLVARNLARLGGAFDVVESFGTAADLVTDFEHRARVLIVDACRSGDSAGTVHRFDVHRETLPDYLNAVSSHGIGVAEGIALARALGMLPEKCEVIAIEGADFRTGARLSAAVATAIDTCVDEIFERLSPSPRSPAHQ